MAKTVEIGWETAGGEAMRVRVSVSPGTPQPTSLTPESRWVPGDEEPTVEVLDVIEDRPGGAARPELVSVVEDDFVRIQELALERADDGPDEPPDDDGFDPWADTREEARGER
jgi:hypothetical protein